MSDKKIKQLVSVDDVNWMKYNHDNETNGDERLAYKMAHTSRKFKRSNIYSARKTNKNTWKEHYEPELKFHASRYGWWEDDYDGPIIKNNHKNYKFN